MDLEEFRKNEEGQIERTSGKEALYRHRTWKEKVKGTDIQKQIMNTVTNGLGYLPVLSESDLPEIYKDGTSRGLQEYLQLSEMRTGTIDEQAMAKQFYEDTINDPHLPNETKKNLVAQMDSNLGPRGGLSRNALYDQEIAPKLSNETSNLASMAYLSDNHSN